MSTHGKLNINKIHVALQKRISKRNQHIKYILKCYLDRFRKDEL